MFCSIGPGEAEQSEENAQAFQHSRKSRTRDPESFLHEIRDKSKPRQMV